MTAREREAKYSYMHERGERKIQNSTSSLHAVVPNLGPVEELVGVRSASLMRQKKLHFQAHFWGMFDPKWPGNPLPALHTYTSIHIEQEMAGC